MSDNESLTLDDVRKRFAESDATLRQIRYRLAGLADAQADAQASADSLREAAGVVTSFGTQAARLLDDLATAQRDARAALEATARFLDGSELTAMRESIDAMRDDVRMRLDQIDDRIDRGETESRMTQEALPRRSKRRLAKASREAPDPGAY